MSNSSECTFLGRLLKSPEIMVGMAAARSASEACRSAGCRRRNPAAALHSSDACAACVARQQARQASGEAGQRR